MYYGCHKVNFRRGGSYIDSPDWIKKKKSNNKSERCRQYFQYVVTVVLNYGENESHPERVSNTRPFINKYKWKGINYASKIDDWKIALNILYIEEKEISPVFISKINSNSQKQFLNDPKRRKRRLALSCGKEPIFIIKRSNIKTPR